MSYAIVQNFIANNRSNRPLQAVGLVVHETATPNASALSERNYFNNSYVGASAHAFIDYSSIIQCIPFVEQAWHAGRTANSTMIGIELCHFDDAAKFNEVWKRAVWLFAYLHINILKVNTVTKDTLMSHAEVSAKWHETDHTDPIGYFASFGKTVDMFRSEVQLEINNQLNLQGVSKVKNLVVYGNSIDRRAAEYVADFYQCPTLDGNLPFDYSVVENVYCVGGAPSNGWTGYAKQIITGIDRFDTIIKALKFIGKL